MFIALSLTHKHTHTHFPAFKSAAVNHTFCEQALIQVCMCGGVKVQDKKKKTHTHAHTRTHPRLQQGVMKSPESDRE